MELTDNDLELIESYFNQSLSDINKTAFEERLKTDVDFKKAAIEYQATVAVLNTVRERESKAFLTKVNATMPPVMLPIERPNFRLWAMAAAVLLMVSVGFWLFKNGDDGVKLKSPVADCFEVYPSLNSTRGAEQKDNNTAAFEAYDARKYAKSADLFGKAFTENRDSILLFYKGIAELGGGETQKAVTNLTPLIGSNIVPQEALYFYLGLAEAENNRTEKAVFWLKKAAYTEGSYRAKAEKALMVLEQKK
jgi:tetratricopeptide (TPR) repeat protein